MLCLVNFFKCYNSFTSYPYYRSTRLVYFHLALKVNTFTVFSFKLCIGLELAHLRKQSLGILSVDQSINIVEWAHVPQKAITGNFGRFCLFGAAPILLFFMCLFCVLLLFYSGVNAKKARAQNTQMKKRAKSELLRINKNAL